jgi:hypothetical protein
MNLPNFLSPRLVGKRFQGHLIPLELLGDLAVLEAMVIEVAKWRYRQENPGRTRTPRKFTEGVTLALTGVEEGSAIANIALSLVFTGVLPPPQQQEYLTQARDAIVGAIAAAGENKSPIAYLPQKALAYFDRFGRSLQDDEAIEFSTGKPEAPARLTKETRLRLLKAAEVTDRTEEIHFRGGIHAVDQEEMTFEMNWRTVRRCRARSASRSSTPSWMHPMLIVTGRRSCWMESGDSIEPNACKGSNPWNT